MRLVACAVIVALVAAVPAAGLGENLLPPPIIEDVAQPFGGPVPPPPPGPKGPAYVPPKADGSVVELLDEGVEPLFPLLDNDTGGESGTIGREDRDVFSGVEATRVTPMQRYSSRIQGWNFKIVEKPKNAGEFRYLRIAWKKIGGTGIMIQLHDPVKSWAFRYYAGRNVHGWIPAKSVSEKIPTEWELVTRDLYKDYGEFTISGFALTSFDGTAGLFDHVLLGRTVEDLDRATGAALGRVKPAQPMAKVERESLWDDLLGGNNVKAAAAQRAFLASAPDHVAFIASRLGNPGNVSGRFARIGMAVVEKNRQARIRKLVSDLDADSFDVRLAATDELIALGEPAADAVRALAKSPPNDEVRYRTQLILRKLDGIGPGVGTAGRMSRAVRVLERANTADARALLGKIADGEFGFEIAPEARAALARMPKTP